jgi:hypothetical protein
MLTAARAEPSICDGLFNQLITVTTPNGLLDLGCYTISLAESPEFRHVHDHNVAFICADVVDVSARARVIILVAATRVRRLLLHPLRHSLSDSRIIGIVGQPKTSNKQFSLTFLKVQPH